MKKEKVKPEKQNKHGAKGILLSMLFFVLMFLFTIGMICSMTVHLILQNGTLQEVVRKIDIAEITVYDGTKTLPLSNCIYEYYITTEDVTAEEIAEVVNDDDMTEYFVDVLDDYSAYLIGDANDLEELEADDVCALMEKGLKKQVGRHAAANYARYDKERMCVELDENAAVLNDKISTGFTGFVLQTTASWIGTIIFGVLMILTLALWMVLGISGQWGAGKILRNYGWSAAIPGLLGLASAFTGFILIRFTNVLSVMNFLRPAGFQWLAPLLEVAGIVTVYGAIFIAIGIAANRFAAMRHAGKQEIEEAPITISEQPAASDQSSVALAEEPFIPPTAEQSAGTCSNCGTQNAADCRFCAKCGTPL